MRKKKDQGNTPEKEAAASGQNQTAEEQRDTKEPKETAKQEDPVEGQTAEEKTSAEPEDKKELSETDVLKLYLEQAMAEIKRLKGENESAKKESDENRSQAEQYKQKLSSVVAEYDNYRRRTATEKENIYNDAVAKSVKALLPALDSLERSMPFAKTNPESFTQGVEMTLKQMESGFESLGVSEIEADGVAFNPDVHNAVMHVEDDSLGESMITEVFQKGYMIGEKVIRHSVVKVAN